MKTFEKYVDSLDRLVQLTAKSSWIDHSEAIDAALDGQAASVIRNSMSLATQRSVGVFFTGSELAARMVRSIHGTLTPDSRVFDPAVGAGNLLVAIALQLPSEPRLSDTISNWGKLFGGCDLKPEFVAATKRRLALAAIRRGASGSVGSLDDSFSEVRVQDGLSAQKSIEEATHLVMNPPFTMVPTPDWCDWAEGKVNAAALFVARCLELARPGTRIVAILPEVLRGGTRYQAWRRIVGHRMQIDRAESYGVFDEWADVDVFILEGTVKAPSAQSVIVEWTPIPSKHILSDHFDVSVGPVVDYRDPHTGDWHPFVTSKNVGAWKEVTAFRKRRRFAGRVIKPPFVVVRRTSRPGDRFRAVGTIIRGKEAVAVENHLIVLSPRNRLLRDCKAALEKLRSEPTNVWLNARICCRHLTVQAVRDLPWSDA